jgi:hypothetical protein
MKHYKVSGNKTIGFRIAIPMEAYIDAMQPGAYTCVSMQNGTLIYQPVGVVIDR